MSFLNKLKEDVFASLKSGEKDKAGILQLAVSAIKNESIAKGKELDETEELLVLRKEAKKIQDSIEQYSAAGRNDLAETEKSQLEVIKSYLPADMSVEDVEKVVKEEIDSMGANSMRDMGRVMGSVMKRLQGQVDGNIVKEIVQKNLPQ